jgi:hypothetical protein
MYYFIKKVAQFTYYYYRPLDRWEGINNYASVFHYSEILELKKKFPGEEYSFIKV